MKITPQFTQADIEADMKKFAEDAYRATLAELTNIGFEFVKAAREKTKDQGGFNDQTGNLRSSIGFIIMYNGKEAFADFRTGEKGTDRATGVAKAREYATEVAKEHPNGWALITVAGMEYASWVEGMGYDVITGSTLDGKKKMQEAEKNIEKALASKWGR